MLKQMASCEILMLWQHDFRPCTQLEGSHSVQLRLNTSCSRWSLLLIAHTLYESVPYMVLCLFMVISSQKWAPSCLSGHDISQYLEIGHLQLWEKRSDLMRSLVAYILCWFGIWCQALCLALHEFKELEVKEMYSIDQPEPLLPFALSCGTYSSPAVKAPFPSIPFSYWRPLESTDA